MRVRAWAAAALAVLGVGAGCTKILGLDDTYQGSGTGGHRAATTAATTGTGGTSACGAFVWDPEVTCQGCMEKSCCGDLLACDTGTPCGVATACVRACAAGDTACLGACIDADATDHMGSGLSAFVALAACFSASCAGVGDCSFPVCTSGYSMFDRTCADCLTADASCCAAFTACDADPVCVGCLEAPAEAACQSNASFVAAYACETVTCGVTCTDAICSSPAFAYYSADCNFCLSQATGGCCAQFDACVMTTTSTCYQCIAGTITTGCSADPDYSAFFACLDSNCGVQCAGF